MKKLIAILMVVAILASMSVSVSAATTTLSTTVPEATYTMNIPADQEIPYGATSTDIGNITITNAEGFAEGKNLYVKVEYDGLFKAEGVSTTIPYAVCKYGETTQSVNPSEREAEIVSGEYLIFAGKVDGTVKTYFDYDVIFNSF